MKWAFLGMYKFDYAGNHGCNMLTHIYGFAANVDWLPLHSKITKSKKNKDASLLVSCALNKRLQEGRNNYKMYAMFYDYFLPCVLKKSVFERQASVATNDTTLCTVSDEAFALLLLENNYDRWVDIYRLQEGEVAPRRGQKRREFESDTPTKYTKGGIVYNETDKNDSPKGWSAEGINRFNELFDLVKKDRKANKTFIKTWLAARKANTMNAADARKRKRPHPQARIELLDDDEDDSENETASAQLHEEERSSAFDLSDDENE